MQEQAPTVPKLPPDELTARSYEQTITAPVATCADSNITEDQSSTFAIQDAYTGKHKNMGHLTDIILQPLHIMYRSLSLRFLY